MKVDYTSSFSMSSMLFSNHEEPQVEGQVLATALLISSSPK